MGMKSWFSLLKRFFNVTETHSRATKEKRRRLGSGRHKIKSSDPVSASAVSEAAEEQNQKSPAIKVGSNASNQCEEEIRDDEVAGLANTLHSTQQCEEETREISALQIQAIAATKIQTAFRVQIQAIAATQIQTAFRGYLARKALRALKGIVRLQAIIRGHAVRRQAVTTLKRLQSVVSIQSQVCARRIQIAEGTQCLQDFKDKLESNSQRRWDDNLRLKDESNALISKGAETFMKRERIKEYLTRHRRSAESEPSKVNSRWRYWLEQWVDTQLSKNPDTDFPPNAKKRSCVKKYQTERLDSSPLPVQRRSFHHRRQRSVGDDNGFASTPIVPTYMAATESAKARARSMSSPRREINLDAYYSESNSPYKHKLSPRCSINGEVTSSSSSRIRNLSGLQQSSPRLKGPPGRLKLNGSLKNLSFDSECSLPNWDRNGALR